MDTYGGKFQKRREQTRERVLQEKLSFIKTFFITISLTVVFSTGGYLGYKYFSSLHWNHDVLLKTRSVWKGMDTLEVDLLNSVLFLKGCRRDIVFQETDNGFELKTVASRTQSMEVLPDIPYYSNLAIPAYLGGGIRPGDKIVQCTPEEEKVIEFKISRKNVKSNFDYLIFADPVSYTTDVPTNLIKFTPVTYRWEKISDDSERLLRKIGNEEAEVMTGIKSHSIEYSFKGAEDSYFKIDILLNEKFPDGKDIHLQRNIPLISFQRLPRELLNKTL